MKRFRCNGREEAVSVHGTDVTFGGRSVPIEIESHGGASWTVAGRPAWVARKDRVVWVHTGGRTWAVREVRGGREGGGEDRVDPVVAAPMTGRVVKVNFSAGDLVPAGEAIVVVEAMKMEHSLSLPVPMRVGAVRVAAGDRVDVGQVLVLMEEVP